MHMPSCLCRSSLTLFLLQGRCGAAGSTVTVTVTDTCPECAAPTDGTGDHFDLNALAYNVLSPMVSGRIDVNYRVVACTPPSALKVKVDGASGTGLWLRLLVTVSLISLHFAYHSTACLRSLQTAHHSRRNLNCITAPDYRWTPWLCCAFAASLTHVHLLSNHSTLNLSVHQCISLCECEPDSLFAGFMHCSSAVVITPCTCALARVCVCISASACDCLGVMPLMSADCG